MKIPKELIPLIKKEKKFFISTHINPDGDAIGSSLALSMALDSIGKEAVVYNRDQVPEFYKFLPGHGRFTNSYSPRVTSHSSLMLLDCNDPERAELDKNVIRRSVVIDHHETESSFGDIRWIDRGAAATGMMVYYLIKGLGIEITKDIATNLYTAIAVDTGTFRYSNTTSEVLDVCSGLVGAGAEPHYIAESMYETWSEGRFRLLITALNTMEILGPVAVTSITRKMFSETGTSAEDTENFSNFPRMMKGIKLSALFRETGDDQWKASLRSKGAVNVARIAEEFGGGGHSNAAGYKIKADLKTAKEALLKAVNKKWEKTSGK